MSENTHITNRPLVFIHGAWHGAWCWDPWIEIFKNQGYSATAIELRGHGYKKGEYKHARLEDYIVDVETVLNVFDEPPILIGHSLGCSIIQHVISTQGYPAAVLVAPIPAPHVFRSILLEQMLRHPILALKSLVTMDMKPWAGSRVSKKMFFSTAANDLQSKTYLDLMQGESFELFILDLIAKKSKPLPQTPLLVVGAEQDAFFHVAAQRETAAHLSANFLLAHNSGHDVMLDAAADAVPQQIIEWLKITLAK